MSSLNPNHPVTREMEEQWHKIAAMLLFLSGKTETQITLDDVDAWQRSFPDGAIAIRYKEREIELRLVTAAEAIRLAKQEGGLPQ